MMNRKSAPVVGQPRKADFGLAKGPDCGLIGGQDNTGMEGKLDTLQTNEIAEGVEIRLRVAGPPVRALAWVIDFWIKFVIMIAAVCGFGTVLATLSQDLFMGFWLILAFALETGYFLVFEWSKLGATPGKMMLGLQVVRMSGAPLTFRHALTRNLLRLVDMLPAYGYMATGGLIPVSIMPHLFGLAACLGSRNFQRLGDLAANTVVIYKEKTTGADLMSIPLLPNQQVAAFPPACPLTREEQEAIVKFADRLGDWSEARKQELANHAQPLTGATGGPGVARLLGIAHWIRTSK